jgi:hypothetical protein
MPRQRNRATDRIGGGQGLERRRARRRGRCGWRSGGAKARRTVRIGIWPGQAAIGSCRRTVRGPQRRGRCWCWWSDIRAGGCTARDGRWSGRSGRWRLDRSRLDGRRRNVGGRGRWRRSGGCGGRRGFRIRALWYRRALIGRRCCRNDGRRSDPRGRTFGRSQVLDYWHFWPRNIAADKSRNGPHHYRHGDDDGGENEYAL